MCGLMNIDIPQLSSSGIEFGNHSFQFVDSIQSSSRFSNFSFFHRCNWTWVGYSADTTGNGACSIMIQLLSIILISSLCSFLNTIPIICPNRKSNNNRIHFPREYSHNRALPLLTSTLMLSRVFARNLPTVVHSCPPARFLSTIPYQHISLKVLIQTE